MPQTGARTLTPTGPAATRPEPFASWLGEGQAELGTELVGMALRGDDSRRDYGADVVNRGASALGFYRPRFEV